MPSRRFQGDADGVIAMLAVAAQGALRRGAGESSALRDAVEKGGAPHLPPTSRASAVRHTAGLLKLRVGYPMLALGSGSQGEAGLVVGARSAVPSRRLGFK